MIGLKRTVLAFSALVVWAGPGWSGTIAASVADYNAAKVRLANGVLTVPAAVATYTANSTLAIGSAFVVTLPSGMTFGSAPTLTSSGTATFTLASGGTGAQSATFTVATAAVTATQTIILGTFTLDGATALETVTPVASALPLTMQAVGTDASPLSVKAFASDVGATAVSVGAIQFVDLTPPSDGTEFGYGTGDSRTAVIAAVAISPQLVDAATSSVPILGSNGALNTLLTTDTATLTITGNFANIGTAFGSTTSDCLHPFSTGWVTYQSVAVPNIPIDTEEFVCVTANGGQIQLNPNGFKFYVSAGSSTDFLSAAMNNEFAGLFVCYDTIDGVNQGGCPSYTVPTPGSVPTLSEWGMIGLAGMIVLFGVWKLKATPTS